MIDQFIQQAVGQLNISQGDAEEATSGLLSVIQGAASSGDFSSLLSQVGGAETLMNKFEAGNDLGGGSDLMGGLMGAASSLLGDNAGSLGTIATLVSQVNLDGDKLGGLAAMFFEFIKDQAGESLAQSVMGNLGDFLGGTQAA